MAEFYYPFDSGNGASVTQTQWQRMAQYFENSGVCGGNTSGFLKVTAPGTGMTTIAAPGDAFIRGFFYYSDANITVTHLPNNSGSPVIDLIVLRLDTVAKTISIPAPIRGTPGTNPVSPTPTYPSTIGATIYEIPLAQVRVESGVSSISSDKVTDARQFSSGNASSSYVSYTPVVASANAVADTQSNWTLYGRSSQSGNQVNFWGYAKWLGPSVTGGGNPLSFSLPVPAANSGFEQPFTLFFHNTTPTTDLRQGIGTIASAESKFTMLLTGLPNGATDTLKTFFPVNLNGTGERFQWSGTYETSG